MNKSPGELEQRIDLWIAMGEAIGVPPEMIPDYLPDTFSDDIPLELGVYLHSKSGDLYEVIGEGNHTEQGLKMVMYYPINETTGEKLSVEPWLRPKYMFMELVKFDDGKVEVPRFQHKGSIDEMFPK